MAPRRLPTFEAGQEAAFLAWGAVHLTLLSAWEDRTKAMVDWTWGGFSHERPGRILVGDKET